MKSFDEYYFDIYGARWSQLRESLISETHKVFLASQENAEKYKLRPTEIPSVYIDSTGMKQLEGCYALDLASVLATTLVDVPKNGIVLDMCSAPGGKALCYLWAHKNKGIQWILNDLSSNRVARLKNVVHEFAPPSEHSSIKVYNRDASRWGLREPNTMDLVVLDAPCSGERNIVNSQSDLKEWTQKRTKYLHIRQLSLACAAIDCLKVGGHLIYSTCSISPHENDELIGKLLKKRAGKISTQPIENITLGQPTKYGWEIYPDLCDGYGPIYCAKIKKTAP